jgi:Cdc6-like AAA superfamily ATPase
MTRASENSDSRPLAQLSFNDAPIDMLSVHFSGRNSELEILEKNLGETSANQPSRCAIHGMPGLGKTQVALQYTKRFFDSRSNAVVFWIPASSIEKINQSFSKILNLVAHPDRRHPEQSARQIAARRWLEEVEISGPINWLLVFDNVNIITLEFLREHLPRHGKHGQILFTTRTERVAEALCEAAGQKYPTIELKVLDMPDATQLFLDDSETRSGQESSSLRSKVVQLVKYLGCLPLAINQAASLMKESYQSVDDLLESFHQDEKNHVSHQLET